MLRLDELRTRAAVNCPFADQLQHIVCYDPTGFALCERSSSFISTVMDAIPDEHVAKRRKMRKGTHSCWECRRRKVKCLLALPNDAVCINCSRRGTSCIGQDEVLDGHYSATNEAEEQTISQIFGQYRNVVSKGESSASLTNSPNAMTVS